MRMNNEEEKSQQNAGLENLLRSVAFSLLHGIESCFTVFLRSHLGSRYLARGLIGGVAVLWLWVENYPAPELIPFGVVWLAALIVQRVITSIDERGHNAEHRDFGGYPAVVSRIPLIGRCEDMTLKCTAEPALLFALSYAAAEWSPALGKFFAVGSFVLVATASIGRALIKEEIARIRDDRLRGRYLANQQRRGR